MLEAMAPVPLKLIPEITSEELANDIFPGKNKTVDRQNEENLLIESAMKRLIKHEHIVISDSEWVSRSVQQVNETNDTIDKYKLVNVSISYVIYKNVMV